MKKLLLLTLTVTVLGAVSLRADDTKSADKSSDGKDKKEIPAKVLEKYDKNKNGVLDADEKEAMKKDRQEALKKFDKNGDGKLDEQERAAAKEASEKHHKKGEHHKSDDKK